MYMDYINGKYAAKRQFVLLAINIPEQTEQSPKAVENIFAQLRGAEASGNLIEKYIEGKTQESFSFEIASTDGYIQYYVRTNVVFRDFVEALFYAQYPDAEIIEVPDYAESFPNEYPNDDYKMWGTEFELINKEYFPIKTYQFFEHSLSQELKDPIAALLEILGKMKKGEHAWVQLVLTPIREDWKDAGTRAVQKMLGREIAAKKGIFDYIFDSILGWMGAIFDVLFGKIEASLKESKIELGTLKMSPGEVDKMKAIEQKISKIGFRAKYRMIYLAKPEVFSKAKGASGIWGAIAQYNDLQKNGFKPDMRTMTTANYFLVEYRKGKKQERLIKAYKKRSNWLGGVTGFVLNIEELASIFHFPSIEIKAPKLKRTPARRAGPPITLPTEEFEEAPHLIEDVKEESPIKEEILEKEAVVPVAVVPVAEEVEVKEKKGKYVSKSMEAPPNLPV